MPRTTQRVYSVSIIVASVTAVWLSSVCSVHADFVPTRYEAHWTSTPPVIDGQLDDAVWQDAQLIDEFFVYQSGGDPAAADTSARILWDDDWLYVGFEMSDVDIRSSCGLMNECGHDARLFRGDVIELFIRESTSSPRYHEFEWSPHAEEYDARFDDVRFGAPGTDWDPSGMISAATVLGTADQPGDADELWTVEVAIPLDSFELVAVTAGTEWTFTVARYDHYHQPPDSAAELMMSTPGDPDAPLGGVTHGFHTYEIYDILEFVQDVPGDGNGDGKVDGLDYIIWAMNFDDDPADDPPGPPENGDFNADGRVDGLDYITWASNFGQGPGDGITVPEPSSIATLFVGVIACGLRRRSTGG